MINLLMGPPGGGKSYEAVVFHILPSIQEGRKVITNLPLNLDEFTRLEPRARKLIEVRQQSRAEGYRAFAHVDDYADDWRDPKTNIGALFVIDEAHKSVPRHGITIDLAKRYEEQGRPVPHFIALDEFYAEHRHTGSDILLITQSHGKISKAISDQVQTVYRVRKMVAFGKSDSYIRKVHDGVRGEVMAETIRTYEPRYFKLYTSHTKSLSAVIESAAKDIAPRYKKFIRAGVLTALIGVSAVACNLIKDKDEKPSTVAGARTQEHAQQPQAKVSTPAPKITPQPTPEPAETQKAPFDGMGIHVQGVIRYKGQTRYLIALSQNGQVVAQMNSAEFEQSGYKLAPAGDCAVGITYASRPVTYARCDLPRVTATPAKTPQPSAETAAQAPPDSAPVIVGGESRPGVPLAGIKPHGPPS